jgi:lipoprotein
MDKLEKPLNNHKMKNRVFVFFVMLILFSCKEEKVEFVQSRAIPHFFLMKNPSIYKNDYVGFYRYTSDTKYFIENEGDNTGGFSQNSIIDYSDEEIASFVISKCEKDTTKLVGKLFFII